jgi:hypothetical protein
MVVKVMTLGMAIVTTLTMGASRVVVGPSASALPAFSDLPSPVLQELQSRGCKLPDKKSKGGVIIRGEFFRPGRFDWAALCSTKMSTSLLVFPDGSRERVEVLETMPKRFSKWSISVVDQERLTLFKSTWGWRGPTPADLDHRGISSFVEFGERIDRCLYCYSAQESIHYYYQDRWLKPVTMIVN